MLALAPEVQLRIYASLRSLETRALAFEALVGTLKRCCVHGGPGAMPQLVGMASELRWQLRQIRDLSGELDGNLGLTRGAAATAPPPAPKTPADDEHAREAPKEPPGFRGTTDVLGVPDLVGVLSGLRKTGTLALHAGDAMFVFEFQEGRVVHAVTNNLDPELRLGTILVAQNKLTEAQLQDCIDRSTVANELLGAHLVSSATVSESDLRAALDVQVHRIFDAAFQLTGARFTFLEGNLSNIAQRTTVNTTELLLEAARVQDETGLAGGRPRAAQGRLDAILGG